MCLISRKLLPLYAGQKLNKRFEIEYDNSHNYLIINKLQTLLQICPYYRIFVIVCNTTDYKNGQFD